MLMKGITLRGLEVFEALASTGSVAQTATRTGLSQPAVSQQLRNLEAALGTDLVDHGRRPMALTPAGTLFLNRARIALSELRAAQGELVVMDLAHIDVLNIGIIDDFDDKITPRLATILADSLTESRLKVITAPSNELANAMNDRKLHLAISASSGAPSPGLIEYPVARDPFMIVAPSGFEFDPKELDAPGALPLLRYDEEQLISGQIEDALAAQGLAPPRRFEIRSHLALMSMVARGIGWAITTPLGYMRADRFRDAVTAYEWPYTPFERRISVFASTEWSEDVPKDVAATMRRLIQTQMIDPAMPDVPFLSGKFATISEDHAHAP